MPTHTQGHYNHMSPGLPGQSMYSESGLNFQSPANSQDPSTPSRFSASTSSMLGQQLRGLEIANTATFSSSPITNQQSEHNNQSCLRYPGQEYSGPFNAYSQVQDGPPHSSLSNQPNQPNQYYPTLYSSRVPFEPQGSQQRRRTIATDPSSQTSSIGSNVLDQVYGVSESPINYAGETAANFGLGCRRGRSGDRPHFAVGEVMDYDGLQQPTHIPTMETSMGYEQRTKISEASAPRYAKSSSEIRSHSSLETPTSPSPRRWSSVPKARGEYSRTAHGQQEPDKNRLCVPRTLKQESKEGDHQPRQRALTPEGRRHASEVRKYSACKNCKRRKVKCIHVLPEDLEAQHSLITELGLPTYAGSTSDIHALSHQLSPYTSSTGSPASYSSSLGVSTSYGLDTEFPSFDGYDLFMNQRD